MGRRRAVDAAIQKCPCLGILKLGGQCPPIVYGRESMPNYRRTHSSGGTYFFTVVTHQRQGLFDEHKHIRNLRASIIETREAYPFNIGAWVLLPDHMHCIWTLPDNDSNFSIRWGLIKTGFTRRSKDLFADNGTSPSRIKHRESPLWQRRFWEHEIRSEQDLNVHIDYIHYNPVKHGHVTRVRDWPYSTFHRYVERG